MELFLILLSVSRREFLFLSRGSETIASSRCTRPGSYAWSSSFAFGQAWSHLCLSKAAWEFGCCQSKPTSPHSTWRQTGRCHKQCFKWEPRRIEHCDRARTSRTQSKWTASVRCSFFHARKWRRWSCIAGLTCWFKAPTRTSHLEQKCRSLKTWAETKLRHSSLDSWRDLRRLKRRLLSTTTGQHISPGLFFAFPCPRRR